MFAFRSIDTLRYELLHCAVLFYTPMAALLSRSAPLPRFESSSLPSTAGSLALLEGGLLSDQFRKGGRFRGNKCVVN